MKKTAARERKTTVTVVRDPATGRQLTVKGLGSMRDRPLNLDPDVDLTKPIFEQVFGERSAKRR